MVVGDGNVGKQDLQGFVFGWSGVSCEVGLRIFVLVCGKVVNSHLAPYDQVAIFLELIN